MALWDRIKESASTMQTQLVAKKNDLKSGAFRDASMAMCALVAAAACFTLDLPPHEFDL